MKMFRALILYCPFCVFFGFVGVTALAERLPHRYDQRFPAIAFSNANYFIVWEDYRHSQNSSAGSRIYGSRMSSDGEVLDTICIAVSTSTNTQRFPAVAFDGVNYLVVWQEYHKDKGYDICGARVNVAGVVIDTSSIPICTAPFDQKSPAVVFGKTKYIVVWMDDRTDTNSDIYFAWVTPCGIVSDTLGNNISRSHNWKEFPACTFNGTDFFVVWTEFLESTSWDIYGVRINQSCVILDTIALSISTAPYRQRNPCVNSNGDDYFVLWHDWRSGSEYDIYGAMVQSSGKVTEPEGMPIYRDVNSQYAPKCAFNGVNCFVVWVDWARTKTCPNLYGMCINLEEKGFDNPGKHLFPSKYAQYSPAICFNGIDFFVVWDCNIDNNFEIHGGRLDKNGTRCGEERPISSVLHK